MNISKEISLLFASNRKSYCGCHVFSVLTAVVGQPLKKVLILEYTSVFFPCALTTRASLHCAEQRRCCVVEPSD